MMKNSLLTICFIGNILWVLQKLLLTVMVFFFLFSDRDIEELLPPYGLNTYFWMASEGFLYVSSGCLLVYNVVSEWRRERRVVQLVLLLLLFFYYSPVYYLMNRHKTAGN